MKNISTAKQIALIAVGLVVGLGATYAMAFTAPTAPAPGGNVAAPINTSATAQTKSGNFGTLGLLNSVGTITSTGGGVRTIAPGLAGSISARNFRATSNAYPGYSGGPAYEIVGQPTGWMAAQQFCLTSNPSTGMPGDPGYNCITAGSGWGGLANGTVEGSFLNYFTSGGWQETPLLRSGTVAGTSLVPGGSVSLAANWGTGPITAGTTPTAPNAVKLDINGGIRIRGNFVDQSNPSDAANAAAEKPGSILTSIDGNGTAAWTSYQDNVKVFVGKHDNSSAGRQRRTMWAQCGKTLTFGGGAPAVTNHGSDSWVAISGGVSCGAHLSVERSAPLTAAPSGVPTDGSDDNLSPFSTYGVPTAAGLAAPIGWYGECTYDAFNPNNDMYVWAVCMRAS